MDNKDKQFLPIIGILHVWKSDLPNKRKSSFILMNSLYSFFWIAIVVNLLFGSTNSAKVEETKVVAEEKKDANDEMKALAIRVKQLGNGTGHDWRVATELERNSFCLYTLTNMKPKEDSTFAASLCREMSVFYNNNDMVNQGVIETAAGIYSFMKIGK